jgi:hypothetical protein
MNSSKTIVCLAQSRKNFGRCVAGKEVLGDGFGGWIRPVSARESAEITEEEQRFEDGSMPRVLDLVQFRTLGAAPLLHQTENMVVDPKYIWGRTGTLPPSRLAELVDHPDSLWKNGDSTRLGRNDRVSVEDAEDCGFSLALIQPERLELQATAVVTQFAGVRLRVRAGFDYRGVHYRFMVTDPATERSLQRRGEGAYPVAGGLLCVSLGEAHTDGYCYKLAATVFALD